MGKIHVQMRRRLRLLFLVGSLSCGLATAAPGVDNRVAVYVDAVHGDDGADGRSPSGALRTLTAAQLQLDALPEEQAAVLRLARGSVWRETFDWRMHKSSRLPRFSYGRVGLRIEAYGVGDKPTISGYDPLSAKAFQRHDSGTYPNVWSQRVEPPSDYWIGWPGPKTAHPAVLVDGTEGYFYVWSPRSKEDLARDQFREQPGIRSEADALAFVNEHPGTFYPRNNPDGTVDYFIHSPTDPAADGRTYDYKVRGGYFIPHDNTWKDIRFLGLSHRDGVTGPVRHLRGVEFLYGTTHNMLIYEGHFEDVLSAGVLLQAPEVGGEAMRAFGATFGGTYSLFHTHGIDSAGLIYDRCTGRDSNIAFYDHHARANREAVILRDCITENVRSLLRHGASTRQAYIVGHRHTNTRPDPVATIGDLTAGKNFIEDSIFIMAGTGGGQWHKDRGGHLHLRNSVILVRHDDGPAQVIKLPGEADWLYEHVTLILDLNGLPPHGELVHRLQAEEAGSSRVTWVIRDSVIVVVGSEGIRETIDGEGLTMTLAGLAGDNIDLRLENTVLTFFEGIPEKAGVEGQDYVFAPAKTIFEGDPSNGDFTLNPEGPAAQRDAGYREGRGPVFRPRADVLARDMPFYQRTD